MTKNKKSERLFLIAIVFSMCIWGFSWSSAKILSGYGSASSIAFIRFVIVMFSLLGLIITFKIDFKIKRSGLLYVIAAGFFLLIYSLLFFSGLQLGKPGAGGVLVTTTNPIFAYLIGLIISRVLPKKMEIVGLIIGVFAGSVLLNVWSEGREGLFDLGNSLFLISALTWAIMSKFSSQSHRFGHSVTFIFWMHVFTVIGFTLFTDLNEVSQILQTGDTKFWLNMIYFGTINSTLATTCYLYAASKLGAEKASSFIYLVPSAALFGSWLFLGEEVLLHTVIGGVLGVLAVFIINKKSEKIV